MAAALILFTPGEHHAYLDKRWNVVFGSPVLLRFGTSIRSSQEPTAKPVKSLLN
jgi:hypothetical protein